MYETRHTLTSWVLTMGETPKWVARDLGHIDTSMVYKTYCRYIATLTTLTGSAFERKFAVATNENSNAVEHNFGKNWI